MQLDDGDDDSKLKQGSKHGKFAIFFLSVSYFSRILYTKIVIHPAFIRNDQNIQGWVF